MKEKPLLEQLRNGKINDDILEQLHKVAIEVSNKYTTKK
jgi:hypothetical protein